MGYFEDLSIESEKFWKKPSIKTEGNYWYITNGKLKFSDRYFSDQYISQLYSKDQQAVIKIVSHACGSSQIKKVFDYIGREGEEETVSFENDQGRIYSSKDERYQLIKEWSEDFISRDEYKNQEWKLNKIQNFEEEKEKLEYEKETNGLLKHQQKRLDDLNKYIEDKYYINNEGKKVNLRVTGLKDTTHIILSIGGKADIKKASAATRNFVQENFAANGFKYALAMHDDTDNLHFHLIVNNKSVFRKNLRFDKADLFVLRNEYSRHLSRMGIERVSTLRKDREEVLEKIKKGTEILKERNTWYQEKIKDSKITNFNAYLVKANLLSRINNIQRKVERRIKFDKNNKQNFSLVIKELKSLKKSLEIAGNRDKEVIIEKSINALSKDHEQIAKKLQGLNDNFNIKNTKNKKQLKSFLKNHRKELKALKAFILRNPSLFANDKSKIEKLNSLILSSKSKGLEI